MKILDNVDLSKYTTIKVGGTAKKMYVPETARELIDLINSKTPLLFLGGGSNLLINNREFENVVSLKSFDTSFEDLGKGRFKVGASVRLQTLINKINEHGRGGIEYLFSVPGLVGGAVVMNAGRGRAYNKCISDYIISVDVIRGGKLVTLSKDECGFDYRFSVFKNSDDIVASVLFEFPEMSQEESSRAKKERIDLCKAKQDNSSPNFGTVFMESNRYIMAAAKKCKIGGKRAHFSSKTSNWMLNEDNATFEDVINAMEKVERLHKRFGKKCKREVIVWE